MPSKYTIREFVPGGYYHIFNRGNAKGIIFRDRNDYRCFLSILADYLLPPRDQTVERKNFSEEIHLLAFCLMPNHFHFCVQQEEERSIAKFVQCITQVYTHYFNKRYMRVGHVFQSKYGARLLRSSADFLNATRYIHANPIEIPTNIETYPYSSFQYFVKKKGPSWLKHTNVLETFSGAFNPKDVQDAYCSFVVTYAKLDFHKGGSKKI